MKRTQLLSWWGLALFLWGRMGVAGPSEEARRLYEAGLAHKRAGRYQEALAELKRALDLAPNYADAHWALGWTYVALQRNSLAIYEFRTVRRLELGRPRAEEAYRAAQRLEGAGETPDAVAYPLLEQALEETSREPVPEVQAQHYADIAAEWVRFDPNRAYALLDLARPWPSIWALGLREAAGFLQYHEPRAALQWLQEALAAVIDTPYGDLVEELVTQMARMNLTFTQRTIQRAGEVRQVARAWYALIQVQAQTDPQGANSLIKYIQGPAASRWRAAAQAAVLSALARTDPGGILTLSLYYVTSDEHHLRILAALAAALRDREPPQAAALLEEVVKRANALQLPEARERALLSAVRELAATAPAEAFSLAEKLPAGEWRMWGFLALADAQIEQDPHLAWVAAERAWRETRRLSGGSQRARWAAEVFRRLGQLDFDRARALAEKEPEEIAGPLLGAALWGLARVDRPRALALAGEIEWALHSPRWLAAREVAFAQRERR